MSIIQAIIGTNLTISSEGGGGGGGVSPDGSYYFAGSMLPWGAAGDAPTKPTWYSLYSLPDNQNSTQVWEFNGSNQWMTTGLLGGWSQFYMNIWFYPYSANRQLMIIQDTLLGNPNSYHHTALEINSDLTVKGKFWANGYLTTANTVTLNAWNHIHLRHNGSQTFLQLNGGTPVTQNNSWSPPANVAVGFGTFSPTNGGAQSRYHGLLAYVELNNSNMASNYDFTRSRFEAPQVFLYDDFTIEWWQKAEANGRNSRPWAIGLLGSASGQEFAVSYEGNGKDYFWINNGYANGSEYQPLKNHYGIGWEHMALVRKDGTLKAYSNGSNYMTWPYANQAITALNADLVVGTGEISAGHYQGFIKDLHIIKGYAKYTTNFLPPTTPIYPQTGSVFLLPVVANGGEYDDVIGYKSATLINTPTFSSDTPYSTSTSITVDYPAGLGNELAAWFGEDRTTIDAAGVSAGWTITGSAGGGSITVTGIDYQHIYFAGQSWLPGSYGSTTYTFTSPDPGGSLYFDTGDYINYGASVDWAFDVDGIATTGLSLNLDANDPQSYSGSGDTWSDLSVGNFPFTLYGNPYYTAGSQSSLNFNGSSQYSTGPAVNMLPDSGYTKMVWFKINSFSADNNIVSSATGGHYMYFNNTTTLWAGHANVGPPYSGPGAFGSNTVFSADTWYCAAVTYDSGTNSMKMYVNGVLDNQTDIAAHTGNGSTNLACFSPGGNLLNGKIGRVLCYTRELTAQEVLNNFNATRNRYGI